MTLQAKDLRIGNWVHVSLIDKSMSKQRLISYLDFETMHKGGLIYEPIPLTSEWLERFGFDFDQVCYWKRANEDDPYTQIDIGAYKDGFYYVPDSLDSPGIKIETVHHLQNWWYALTLTELTLKEPQEAKN